jgi:hypothetical protein
VNKAVGSEQFPGLFILIGTNIYFVSSWAWISLLLALVVILIRVPIEERYLVERFGQEYIAYQKGNTEASDVDVVVELGQPDLLALVGIKQELEELLHRPVDVVRYRERMKE